MSIPENAPQEAAPESLAIGPVSENFQPPSDAGDHDVAAADVAVAVRDYWTDHNVTLHYAFASAPESIDYFHWRNAQYIGYIDLMPVDKAGSLAVLDYGCGPGHDLVGFGLYSRPRRLVGMDLSPTSLAEARYRLGLHGIDAELVTIDPEQSNIPLENGAIDLVHSSGVLHHTTDPEKVLAEFYRIMKPGGKAQIMVYNADSLWMHLYVAYVRMVAQGEFQGMSLHDAFEKTTDGPDCPIARAYTHQQFSAMAKRQGFEVDFSGASVSLFEMSLLPRRFEAMMDRRLPKECREFLSALRFDNDGVPRVNGVVAGVDACFALTRRPDLRLSRPA